MSKDALHCAPVYVDSYAWDDLKKREPGGYDTWYGLGGIVQSPAGWIKDGAGIILVDYCAAIYYELDNMAKGSSRTVYTMYQASFDGLPVIYV